MWHPAWARNAYKILAGKFEAKEELVVDGGIILNLVVKK
jgi:hypothetical protein